MTRETDERGHSVLKLASGDWIKLAVLLYTPLAAAIGWAVSMDSRMAVMSVKISNIEEKVTTQNSYYITLEGRLRAVEVNHNNGK